MSPTNVSGKISTGTAKVQRRMYRGVLKTTANESKTAQARTMIVYLQTNSTAALLLTGVPCCLMIVCFMIGTMTANHFPDKVDILLNQRNITGHEVGLKFAFIPAFGILEKIRFHAVS